MSAASAVVCSGKRSIYVFDEGPTSSFQLPSDWQLIARDAFNGKVLWKRPLDRWHPQKWSLKNGPAQLPRQLVTVDDVAPVTLTVDSCRVFIFDGHKTVCLDRTASRRPTAS
jgi:hypothetical protein